MNKFNKHTVKKSIKPLMMFSVIATLLMAAISTTATTNMNASAFNFGLKSKDINDGSISTNSLFSCTGAAINCINTNQGNNNEIANNTAVVDNGNGILTCEECLSEALTLEQQAALLAALDVTNLAAACIAIAELDATDLLTILTGNVGLSLDAALELLACLDIDAPPVIIG
jgi:hypothetical protein